MFQYIISILSHRNPLRCFVMISNHIFSSFKWFELRKKAIMQRGSIEHEQIIYISSNRRMKQLMDWLSNPHWTPDTRMLTYLLLSNGTQAKGEHSCPVRRCFEDFTSHQLNLRRSTVHANLALKQRTKRTCDAGAPIVRCLLRRIQQANTPASLPALTLLVAVCWTSLFCDYY